jgi:ABC-type amino acid transport system permease subunit
MSKNTSLLSVIAVAELLDTAQAYFAVNFRYFEALSIAAVYYLLITSLLTWIQRRIEARFGERRDLPLPAAVPFWRRAIGFAGAR